MDFTNPDTTGPGQFPVTRHSALRAIRDGTSDQSARAYDAIVSAYWKPVYKYIRLRWNKNRDDAQDLTQSFFARVLEKDFFATYDLGRARFRTFLRLCLDRHIGNVLKAQTRDKRGGDQGTISLDFDAAEHELDHASVSPTQSPDQFFEREWVRALLENSVEMLRQNSEASGRQVQFQIFSRYDLERFDSNDKIPYQQLADKFKISTTDVTNYLAAMRREFRQIVLDRIRDLAGNDDDFRDEVRAVLGIDAP